MVIPSPSADLIQLLCVACVDLLEVDGAGISLMTVAGGGGMAGAHGDLAEQVEEWQFSLGEGPCKDAFMTGEPVIVGDIDSDAAGHGDRWPVFAETIHRAGIRSIFAFPLQVSGYSFGALDLFRYRTGLLSAEQVGVASAFADMAGALLKTDAMTTAADDRDEEVMYRYEVHQAAGIVAAQLEITGPEALLRLRARAFAEGRTVTDLASDLVGRRIRFSEEDL